MKKLLAIAAMSAVASLGTFNAEAGSWDILCLKQGPVRQFPGFGFRSLDPNSCVNGPAQAQFPIPARSNPCQGKVAEKSDIVGDMNFVSLGFGGQAVLVYSDKFAAVPGANNDIALYETTWGDPACTPNVSESALVEFSQDGINWTAPKFICHNGYVDIAPLEWGKYVRITDATNPALHIVGDGNDAWDLDGLEATADFDPGIPGNPLCDYQQGVLRKWVGQAGNFPGRGIVAQRKNFANANINDASFTPAQIANPALREVSGWYNFWSIGFKTEGVDAYACFHLPYTVFDGPGADFYSYETTWNNKPCPNYPETVEVSVSADGINWSASRLLCKDGVAGGTGVAKPIDLADFGPGFEAVNYIKYVDASNPASFGQGDDSYDIDNILILQLPPGEGTPVDVCGAPTGGRRALSDIVADNIGDGGVPEEMFALDIAGANIVSDKISFTATIAEEGGYFYSIRDHIGREVIAGELKGSLYETPVVEENVSALSSGVYFITLKSNNSKETVKFVKK